MMGVSIMMEPHGIQHFHQTVHEGFHLLLLGQTSAPGGYYLEEK